MYFYSYPIHTTISIRAPARGATDPEVQKHPKKYISIRAPARGATADKDLRYEDFVISIRAPARGATQCGCDNRQRYRYFNPRSREGSDTHSRVKVFSTVLFQSALPRGERRCHNYLPPAYFISIRAPARGATVGILP